MRRSDEPAPATLAVIIPAYNAAATLPDCLAALTRSIRQPDEIILFDDGSTDATAEIARASGARVLTNGRRAQGPAIGRNFAAGASSSDIIAFVDADVAVSPQALGLLEAPLLAGEALASFGSYDDRPKSRRLSALYANLRHHWVHQHGNREAFTFWSGLGAIRSYTFRTSGGFETSFDKPSIEDVELGIRIVESGGHIRLVKEAVGTHCKDWGIVQLWRTDILQRAIPWALLMKEGRGRADDLNISARERAAAVAAHCVWLAALLAAWRPPWWPALPLAVAAYVVLNARFFSFLLRTGGLSTGIGGAVLHWCYHLYASVTYALVVSGFLSTQRRSRIMKATAGSSQATRP